MTEPAPHIAVAARGARGKAAAMHWLLAFTIGFLFLFLSACASAPPPVARTPEGEPAASAEPVAPSVPAGAQDVVPPIPPACDIVRSATPGCTVADHTAALESLSRAAVLVDAEERQRSLAAMETCAFFEAGVIRALRADLAPEGCADAIDVPEASARREVRDALEGLRLGARLTRLVREPPALVAPYDKARFLEFFRADLVPWIGEQARAIQILSEEGAKLRGYGQGVVAIAAGLADMRFVEAARSVPLPAEMEAAADVRDVYYGSLDEALEPRKVRGRDAALVGLRRLAELGALADPRVARARALLSELFGGRRIDALDGLLLPPSRPVTPTTVEQRLVATLPPFYVPYLLPDFAPTSEGDVGALAIQGVPPSIVARLRATAMSRETALILSRSLFRLGQTYWRATDFQAAAQAVASLVSQQRPEPEARFIATLAGVLARGPRDAGQLMLEGPRYPAGVGDVAPLDAYASEPGAFGPLAAFDAAYVLRLVPPLGSDPGYFDDIARRFRKVGPKLDADARAKAADFAAAAEETAKALRAGPATAGPGP